jgi:hypothetical protein
MRLHEAFLGSFLSSEHGPALATDGNKRRLRVESGRLGDLGRTGASRYRRSVPVTTILTSRLPHLRVHKPLAPSASCERPADGREASRMNR